MKKIVLLAVVAFLGIGSVVAQNTFKGVVTYSVTSTGEVAFQVPEEMATPTVKILEDKVLTNSILFTNSPLVTSVLVDGHTQYTCWDMSMLFMYLTQNDVELDYTGSAKMMTSNTLTQQDIDSLTIPVTDGYYIEYVDGETKTIAGQKAKKAILHIYGDDGEDHGLTMWYSDEMGPDVNLLFNGVRGVALEYVLDMGEGRQLTVTATEVKSSKVKSAEMLLPAGYEEISTEDFQAMMQQIQEEMEYLQDE